MAPAPLKSDKAPPPTGVYDTGDEFLAAVLVPIIITDIARSDPAPWMDLAPVAPVTLDSYLSATVLTGSSPRGARAHYSHFIQPLSSAKDMYGSRSDRVPYTTFVIDVHHTMICILRLPYIVTQHVQYIFPTP